MPHTLLSSDPLVLEILGTLLLAGGALAAMAGGRLRARAPQHGPLVSAVTESGFALLLGQGGVEPRIAKTIFRYLWQVRGLQLKPLPGDHLIWDLGLSDAQVEHSVADLARRLDRSIPVGSHGWPATVEDLGRYLQQLPSVQTAPASRAA